VAELIMDLSQLTDGWRREPLEESSQGRLLGPPPEAQQRTEEAVVFQLVGLADPLDSGDEQEQQQERQVERIELPPSQGPRANGVAGGAGNPVCGKNAE
jgi:hypothetical protein